ncbi:MAG: right-handed parallel beta-helix repeat-containing protein, partial [Anaerolineales bacterium]
MTRFVKILAAALLVTIVLYGVFPAKTVFASDFVVNDTGDAPDDTLDGICDISPGDGTENCTLRAAIMEANFTGGPDVITFSTAMTINLGSALDAITGSVTIDASSTGGLVIVDGNGGAFNGLDIQAGSVAVRALALIDFDGNAIHVSGGADGVIIDGNHLGAASNGTADGGVTGFGVRVIDSPNVSITDNLISGNDLGGVYVSGADSDGASITGNTVGLNLGGDDFLEATPTTDQDGIRLLNVPNAVIGGSGAAGRNIIAGNYGDGIEVSGTAAGTTIDGNYIGTSAIGEDAIPNANAGIRLEITSGVSVGSTQGNLISGNSGPGVVVTGSTDVTISDNLIGLDV